MDTVSEIKEKLNIVDVIGTYVQLKKAGKNYKGRCPFHNEKTPSFMVSEDIQRYRCFGCGKSGDIFNFIQDYEGLEFPEALKLLADKAGVEIKYDPNQAKEKSKTQKIIELNEIAVKFFHYALLKHDFGKETLKYLKERGINQETIKDFKLGYAPKSWNNLTNVLKKNKPDIKEEEIIAAGLARKSEKSKGAFDMFRGRLMFPFIDPLDRVIGFSARALNNEDMPKYINTPETEVFHKERFLFGLNLSKGEVRKKDQIIIVEGMMDMISLYQHGYKNSASTNGTALTLGQINLIKRYTQNIVLVFDNDDAGLEAMIRGISVIQNAGMNIKIASLPNIAKDPDELMQKDPKAFRDVIDKSVPIWDFYFIAVNKKYNFDNVFEKKEASTFLLQKIKSIDDEIVKAEYVKKFADLFGLTEGNVITQMQKTQQDQTLINKPEKISESLVNVNIEELDYPITEIYVLSLLMELEKADIPIYLDAIKSEYFSNDDTRLIFDSLKEELETKKSLDIKAFYDKLQSSQENIKKLFEQIYLLGLDDSLDNSEVIHSELASAINRLKRSYLINELKDLSLAIKKAESVSDTELSENLQKKVQDYTEELNNLSI